MDLSNLQSDKINRAFDKMEKAFDKVNQALSKLNDWDEDNNVIVCNITDNSVNISHNTNIITFMEPITINNTYHAKNVGVCGGLSGISNVISNISNVIKTVSSQLPNDENCNIQKINEDKRTKEVEDAYMRFYKANTFNS